jgi:hypothetical protein
MGTDFGPGGPRSRCRCRIRGDKNPSRHATTPSANHRTTPVRTGTPCQHRHATLAVSTALLLGLAAPISAIDIFVDMLSAQELDPGTPIQPFFEADLSFATGAFDSGTDNLSSPANSAALTPDGSDGGQDIYLVDRPVRSATGSSLALPLGGANTGALTIIITATPPSGSPVMSAFSIVGSDLLVNWSCSSCIQGATSTSNLLAISVFDVATDGEDFEQFVRINAPMGFSGQATIDISGAIAGHYEFELEFFSQRSFSDSVSDVGNVRNVTEGRSVLNGGFGFTITPEPGTGVLVSLGLVALAMRRKRA